jgi:hypothetical protein
MSERLIEILKTSKKAVYKKYREWRSWVFATELKPEIQISEIFNIDRNNKEAIFFILAGLNSYRDRIDLIKDETCKFEPEKDIEDYIYERLDNEEEKM